MRRVAGDHYLLGPQSSVPLRSCDAVFMRNVPRMYALASDPAESEIEPAVIGIAPLPVAEEGLRSYSSLGGWNLFLNANSQNADAAWEFMEQAYLEASAGPTPCRGLLPRAEALVSARRDRSALAYGRTPVYKQGGRNCVFWGM